MDTKGFEKKPWFPYVKNMYDEIEGDMMEVDAKGYEEKPWWPYVLDLQEKIDAGGGGSSDFSTATVTITSGDGVSKALMIPIIVDLQGLAYLSSAFNTANETDEYSVPLYKGEADIVVMTEQSKVSISVSGDGEYVQTDGYIAITGNCTINITTK